MSEPLPIRMRCAGCGTEALPPEVEPYPFRCPYAGRHGDADHVLRREVSPRSIDWPAGGESSPFERYRNLLYSYQLATSHGMTDRAYVDLTRRLDKAVASLDGRGFTSTPFCRSAALAEHLGFNADGGIFVKDETGNVSGSHKARHLMGIMLHLRVADELGLSPTARAPLLIASCGNAALAAAVVARAADWRLRVFVPQAADRFVLGRLDQLGAELITCERRAGEAGDPCHLRFHETLEQAGLPFCVQGSDNALTIEGGETLAWEMIDALDTRVLDRLFIQVGGGALASSCIQAFTDAVALGRVSRLPRMHTVQTFGGFPLKRAYDLVADRIVERLRLSAGRRDWTVSRQQRPVDERQATGDEETAAAGWQRAAPTGPGTPDWERAEIIRACASSPIVQEELRFARTHRSAFMWPWEQEPRSIAYGILDDETYDWGVVVEGMLLTGGYPIVVDEQTLIDANTLAREATGINVDHTGSAGLAGLMQLGAIRKAAPGPGERIAVIFSGVRRPAL